MTTAQPAGYRQPDQPAFPYRSGITGKSYAEEPWIIGQYSGYTSPEQTNQRFRKLIAVGQQGLAVAMDLPTQLGMDPDNELAAGEVGRVGVSLSCVDDMAALFADIPLSSVRQISTTANSIGAMFAAMMIVLAERRGEEPTGFSLRLQNDVLKEYVARGTQIFAPAPGARLSVDVVEYCARHLPSWVPMCVSGYHIRDAGATREQEVGFTLANAEQYLDLAVARGVDIAQFARSMSWFMGASPEFLQEAAKFRACRELWATLLSDKYQIRDEQALRLRINSYTLGGEMSAFEIANNSVRVTLAAVGAVLGGVQSLFCSSIDEALGLPTDETARLSVQTQRIILREAGIAGWVDPLGGGRILEALTDQITADARQVAADVAAQGGSIAAVESGWMRAQIENASWERSLAEREDPRVGEPTGSASETDRPVIGQVGSSIDHSFEARRSVQIADWRRRRPAAGVGRALEKLAAAAAGSGNLMPALIDSFRADATIGEVSDVLIDQFGSFNTARKGRSFQESAPA
jgi:methylmalonyl-CoA mutase, N-terminal domain